MVHPLTVCVSWPGNVRFEFFSNISDCRSFSVFNTLKRVPNRFFGIRDLAYFKAGIRDFEGKGGRDSRLQLLPGHGVWRF